MIIFGLISGGLVKTPFFPQVQFDDIAVDVIFKPGDREDQTERFLRDFEQKVWEVNDDIINETGDSVISYTTINVGRTQNLSENGAHTGHVNVSVDIEGKSVSSFEIASRIRKKIGFIPQAENFAVGGSSRWGKPVSIGLQGNDYSEIEIARDILLEELKSLPDLKDITDNVTMGKRELLLQLKPKAYFLGLTHADITNQIRQGFYGAEVQRLQKGNDEIRIWVRYPDEGRRSIGQIESMKIKTRDNKLYPLSELVDYTIERGIVKIQHYDGKREIRVVADLKDPYTPVPPILEKIKLDIEYHVLTDG
jgi:multidrug efflux pump subunit AcrB